MLQVSAVHSQTLSGYTGATTPTRECWLVLEEPVDLEPGDTLVLMTEGDASTVFVHLVPTGSDPKKVSDSLGIRAVDNGQTVTIRLYESHRSVKRIVLASGEQAYGRYDLGAGNGFAKLTGARVERGNAEAVPTVPPSIGTVSVLPIEGLIESSAEWLSSWISLPAPRDFAAGETLRLTVEGDVQRIFVRAVPEGGDPGEPKISLGSHAIASDGSVLVPVGVDLSRISSLSVHGGASPFGLKGFPEGNGAPRLAEVGLLQVSSAIRGSQLEGSIEKSEQWGSGWLDLEAPVELRKGDTLRLKIGGEAVEAFVRLVPVGTPDSEIGVPLGVFPVGADRVATIALQEDAGLVRQLFVQGGGNAWGLYDMRAYNGAATLLGAVLIPAE